MWWNHRYTYLFKLTRAVSIFLILAIFQVYDGQSNFLANLEINFAGEVIGSFGLPIGNMPIGNTNSVVNWDLFTTVASLYSLFLTQLSLMQF